MSTDTLYIHPQAKSDLDELSEADRASLVDTLEAIPADPLSATGGSPDVSALSMSTHGVRRVKDGSYRAFIITHREAIILLGVSKRDKAYRGALADRMDQRASEFSPDALCSDDPNRQPALQA